MYKGSNVGPVPTRQLEPPRYRQLYNGPDVPQFGGKGVRYLSQLQAQLPSDSVQCQGWGQAKLKHKLDVMEESMAEKYLLGISEHWYYLRIDGWVLAFWKNEHDIARAGSGNVHPVGWLDLRLVRGVQGRREGGGVINDRAPYLVDVGLSTGRFIFNVREHEEMIQWVGVLRLAMAEYMQQQRQRKDAGLEVAQGLHAHGKFTVQLDPRTGKEIVAGSDKQRNADMTISFNVSPGRAADLKVLWEECVSKVTLGSDMKQEFAAMFTIYDFDNSGHLDVAELEIMLRELCMVRLQELLKALELQRQYVLSPDKLILGMAEEEELWQKRVGNPGKKLQAHYEGMLKEDGFENRLHMLRSQLDPDCDGFVTLDEFLRRGTHAFLPRQELMDEFQFYQRCGETLDRVKHGQDDALDDYEEGGCLQQ